METQGPSLTAMFSTRTQYTLPSQKFMIPSSWARYHLSQLVNKVLELPKPVPFDFIIKGQVLRGALGQWCTDNGISTEDNLEIEYVESMLPPQRMSTIENDEWISSISCHFPGYFLSTTYGGALTVYDYSQAVVSKTSPHIAPITSSCWISSSEAVRLVATASHDTTVSLAQVLSVDDTIQIAHPIASLRTHTAPISSVACDVTGSKLITASWDSLIGLWDVSIPETDEVLVEDVDEEPSRKRRKTSSSVKTKAPLEILRSHTAKVSQAVFSTEKRAVSCGMDSTVRTWDIEAAICDNTITAAEKPFTALSTLPSSAKEQVLVTSTDRSLSLYDVSRTPTTSSKAQVTFMHPATPSCIASSPSDAWRVLTGAYDGIVRVWDIRNPKIATINFKAFESMGKLVGSRKILAADWIPGIVGLGGEGGMEIWKVGEDGTEATLDSRDHVQDHVQDQS